MDLTKLMPAGLRPNAAFVVSGVCIGVLALTGTFALVDMLPAAIAPSADPKDVRAFDAQLARHEAAIELASARFTGRSLFVMPSPPYRPPPPQPTLPPEPPPPPKPVTPQAPAEYSGPKPLGMIGGVVYFDSIDALSVGDERDGLKVLGVEPPSHVRVAHRGGTYLVPVWDRSDLASLSKRESGASSPIKSVRPVTDGANASAGSDAGAAGDGAAAREGTAAGEGGRADAPAPAPAPAPPSTPAAPPTPPAPAEPGPDIELPRAEVPTPLSQGDVDAMSRREAQAALAAVTRARGNRNLDEATRARLREDFDMLIKRVRTAPADEGR